MRYGQILLASTMAVALARPVRAQSPGHSVLTYHYDNTRQGANTNETLLSLANVNATNFGKLFSYAVDGYVFAEPLYVGGLAIPGKGVHNVVFVATEHNSVYAFDADSNAGPNGGLLWHTNLGAYGLTSSGDFGGAGYTDLVPDVGITGTPVIDLASGVIYVDAFTHEDAGYVHRIHALDITDGGEEPFSPVIVAASVPGFGVDSSNGVVTFNAQQQMQRPGLTLAGGVLYAAYGSYGDEDPYHGWIIGFEAATLKPLTNYVFNTTPNANTGDFGGNAGEGALWMGGNGLSVDANTNLYFETANGSFSAFTNGGDYSDSFMRLSTTNGLAVADYFTPADQATLAAQDNDLGSGGPLLLPDSVGSAAHPHLLVGAGKEGTIFLIDRDGMGGYNPANNNQIVQELPGAIGGVWSSPAYFNDLLFYHGSGDVLKAFAVTNGALSAYPVTQSVLTYGVQGATPTPVISADGTNDAIAWDIQADAAASQGTAVLRAYNATNLSQEIYDSSMNFARDNPGAAVKYSTPTVINGKVYVGAEYELSVYGYGLFYNTNTSATTYRGLFYDTNAVALQSSGFFTATLNANNSFSANLRFPRVTYSFTGKFHVGGTASASIPRPGLTPISVQLQMDVFDRSVITGQLTDGATWTSALTANRAYYTIANPAPEGGRNYTVIIPGGSATNQPIGYGFGSLAVGAAGRLSFTSLLGDGTAAAETTFVSQDGRWPLFVPLYGGNGLVFGWLAFSNTPAGDLGGQVNWIKLAQPGSYPGGFTNQSVAFGAGYAFTNGVRTLNLTNGVVILQQASPPLTTTNSFSLGTNNVLTGTNIASLKIGPAAGWVTGSAIDPVTLKPILIHGAALQEQNAGFGFYTEAGKIGSVWIGSP